MSGIVMKSGRNEMASNCHCLKQDKGESTSGHGEDASSGLGSSTSVGGDGGSGADGSNSGGVLERDGRGSAGRGLDLSVGDLGNDSSAGGGSLDLSVGDLGDNSTGGGSSLDLSVGDLGDNSGGGSGLELTVSDLRDDDTSGGLDLSVGDLGDNGSGAGGGLNLTIGNLGDTSGGLAVRCLAHGGASANDVDVDLRALVTSGCIVKVVEGTAQALVEESRVTNGKGTVGADRPASSVDGIGLDWVVELELVVGDDLTSAALAVGEDSLGESGSKSSALGDGALGGRRGHVGDGNLEGTRVVGRATGGGRGSRGLLGVGCRRGSDGAGESCDDGEGLHIGCFRIAVFRIYMCRRYSAVRLGNDWYR